MKNTGQAKTINGFDTRQVIVAVTVREKGKTLEESGGMVMTVDNWLTKSQPALKEISPGLKEAFSRYSRESLDGTPIQVTTKIDEVKSADQMKQPSSSQGGAQADPASVAGVIGGFMRRRAQNADNNADANNPRSTFMTTNNEVLKIATAVAASDVAIPAGFKLTK